MWEHPLGSTGDVGAPHGGTSDVGAPTGSTKDVENPVDTSAICAEGTRGIRPSSRTPASAENSHRSKCPSSLAP